MYHYYEMFNILIIDFILLMRLATSQCSVPRHDRRYVLKIGIRVKSNEKCFFLFFADLVALLHLTVSIMYRIFYLQDLA